MIVSSPERSDARSLIRVEPLDLWLEQELARADVCAQTAREFESHRLQAMAHWHVHAQSDCIRVDRRHHLLEDNPTSG